MKIIAITGPLGSGKSTIAKLLQERGKNVTILPMAGPLKEVAKQLGWNGLKDKRGRRLLQRLGTDVGRDYDPYIWTDKWKAQIAMSDAETIICDDVRFMNEVSAVHNIGGVVIRLVGRNELPKWKLLLNKVTRLFGWHLYHVSEEPLPAHAIDHVVNNSGTVESTVTLIEYLTHE